MSSPRSPFRSWSKKPPLHPAGTARALFLANEATATAILAASADPAADEGLPRALWAELRARDVAESSLLGAWEACRWAAPGASPEARRALALLLVALGEAVESGSAFLALAPSCAGALAPSGAGALAPSGAGALAPSGTGGEGLEPWLDRLGCSRADRTAALALAAALASAAPPASLADLFGAPGARRPFILTNSALYPEACWTFEARAASALRRLLARPPAHDAAPIEAALASLRDRAATPRLTDEQLDAIRACLSSPLTLVTGGPGTGKTSIVVGLVRALAHLGVRIQDIAVAAPTGRAAHRIEETLRRTELAPAGGSVATIHRLLGIRGGRRPTLDLELPEHHAGWRLPHRFVICDEASMIDLFMLTAVLEALRDDAHLVLLGDVDQLPSVRLGAAFRDLAAALPASTRRLIASHRMNPAEPAGAAILGSAAGVRDGRAIAPPVTRTRAAGLTFTGVEHLPAARLPELLGRWYDDVLGGDAAQTALGSRQVAVDEDGRLQPDDARAVADALGVHGAARILCVTRAADPATSAEAVNGLLHRRVLARLRDVASEGDEDLALGSTAGSSASSAAAALLPGEPVTILRNDHERALWNGDQGVVVRLAATPARPATRGVAFARGDGLVVHPLDELADNLGLGFALTVHKAQGSEYARVALVLPTVDSPLLSREILYTALTRARQSVVVVGDLALFALGASRQLRRASGLATKLTAARP